jgi:hypothetical protein
MMDNGNIPLLNIFAYFLALLKRLFLSSFLTRSSWSVSLHLRLLGSGFQQRTLPSSGFSNSRSNSQTN